MKYKTIVMDPPWLYPSPGWKGGAHRHYPTLPIAALREIPISEIADEQCHVWVWTTRTMHRFVDELFAEWGVTDRAQWEWVKLNRRPLSDAERAAATQPYVVVNGNAHSVVWSNGFWNRQSVEFLRFGTIGPTMVNDTARQVRSTLFAPVGEHSEKPEEAYELIRSYSPEVRLDMFARGPREGFDMWGDEVNGVVIPKLNEWSIWAKETFPDPRRKDV